MTTWCLIPNLVLYFLASLFYLLVPVGQSFNLSEGRRLPLSESAFVLSLFGSLLHLIYLGYSYWSQNFRPLIFVSLGVVLLFFWLSLKHRHLALGSFFLPLALILFLVSLREKGISFLNFQMPKLVFAHILLASLAFLFMAGSFLFGLIFLVKENYLKKKKWGLFLWNLPALVTNEKMALGFLRIGFVLLTLVLLSGSILLQEVALDHPFKALHVFLALLTWALYSLLLNQGGLGLRWRKMLLLSFLGFVSLSLAYLWTSLY